MSEFILQASREHQDGAGKIRTFTGKYVDPLNMRKEDIDIRDIAHHLSNECRYAGACPHHYSVAQHSCYVSECFTDPKLRLAGLLHDAAEAYLKDIPSPVKHDPRMKWYREIDEELTLMIFDVFGVPREMLRAVKQADNDVFDREVKKFWGEPEPPQKYPSMPGMDPSFVEAHFLYWFKVCNEQIAEQNSSEEVVV